MRVAFGVRPFIAAFPSFPLSFPISVRVPLLPEKKGESGDEWPHSKGAATISCRSTEAQSSAASQANARAAKRRSLHRFVSRAAFRQGTAKENL